MSKTKLVKKTRNKKKTVIGAIISVVIIAVLILIFALSNKPVEHPIYNFNKDIASGIDVSQYNKDIDWDGLKDKIDFTFIRVGYRGYDNGKIGSDTLYEDNLQNANKAGIPVGVYFYSQAISEEEAIEEAEFLIKRIKKYQIDLPVTIDFEYAYNSKLGKLSGRLYEADLTNKDRTKIVNAFCKTVKANGYTPAIYGASSIFKYELDMSSVDKNAIIWVADYNDEVSFDIDYTIWQYSSKGKLDEINSKYVDLNYWYQK